MTTTLLRLCFSADSRCFTEMRAIEWRLFRWMVGALKLEVSGGRDVGRGFAGAAAPGAGEEVDEGVAVDAGVGFGRGLEELSERESGVGGNGLLAPPGRAATGVPERIGRTGGVETPAVIPEVWARGGVGIGRVGPEMGDDCVRKRGGAPPVVPARARVGTVGWALERGMCGSSKLRGGGLGPGGVRGGGAARGTERAAAGEIVLPNGLDVEYNATGLSRGGRGMGALR